MSKKRVVITGLGAITPVGNTVKDLWDSLLEGKSGVRRIQCFDPSRFSCQIAAEVLDFDLAKYFNPKEIKRTDRFVQFAILSIAFCADAADILNVYERSIDTAKKAERKDALVLVEAKRRRKALSSSRCSDKNIRRNREE